MIAPGRPALLPTSSPATTNLMNITRARFLVPAVALVLTCAGTLSAGPEYKQPRMELAVQYLQDALKTEDPAPLMRKAKEELQRVQGSGAKAEFRDRAISILDTGLTDLQEGKKDKVPGDITTALASIQSGMSHGRSRR